MNKATSSITATIVLLFMLTLTSLVSAQENSLPKHTSDLRITVSYIGVVPKNPITDFASFRRDLFQVHKSTQGLVGAVIYLVPMEDMVIPPPDPNMPDQTPLIIDQFDETFEPQVSAVRRGHPVQLTNHDDLNHNVRSSPELSANSFNIVTHAQHDFEKTFIPEPDNRPIKLSCDIHAWMGAWLYVFDHPWFAVTDAQGRASIADIPPGMFRIVIAQPAANLKAQSIIHIRPDKRHYITQFFTKSDMNSSEPGPINLTGFGPKIHPVSTTSQSPLAEAVPHSGYPR